MSAAITITHPAAAPKASRLHPLAASWLQKELAEIIQAATARADSIMPDEDVSERASFIRLATALSRLLRDELEAA